MNLYRRMRRSAARVRRRLQRPSDHRAFLFSLLPKGSVGAEVGVWRGDFAAQLLRQVEPQRLHLVDPWTFEPDYPESLYGGRVASSQTDMDRIYRDVLDRFAEEIDVSRVVVHRGDSEVLRDRVPDGALDWAYIDGNHLYESVRRDLDVFRAKVRPGGFLAGDDYREPGWWGDGVTRAVDELVRTEAAEIVVVKNNQFVLRNRPT